MFSKTRFVAVTAALGLMAAVAFADPAAGTIGTEFTVTFDQDVGTKPKLTLSYLEPTKKAKTPKAKAKLVSSDGTMVTFVIQAAKGGGNFAVGAKKSDADGGVINLAAPRIDSLGTDSVAPGGELVINGLYFGELANKRNAPKVFINGKKAKVTSFADTALTVQLHKKTKAGAADVRVANKVGESTLAGSLTVTSPPTPIKGSDVMTSKLDGSGFKATDKNTVAAAIFNPGINTLVITGAQRSGKSTSPRVRTFAISQIQLGAPLDQITTPLTRTGVQAGIATLSDAQTKLTGPNPGATVDLYDSGGGLPVTVTIDNVSGNRISGTFSCTMRLAGGNKEIQAQSGKFVLTIE